MDISITQILITLFAAAISGAFTAQINHIRAKKERIARLEDKAHDQLLLEIKDLQINCVHRVVGGAFQELIRVKAELEGALLKLTHIEMHSD